MTSRDASKDLIGSTLDDRYLIEELVGRGGMGEVYRARQMRLNRLVALKVPRPGILNDHAFRSRFTREAHSMARVQHVNICQIFDVLVSDDPEQLSYLVLEYVEGTTLDRWVHYNMGEITIGEFLDIFASVADALDAAHEFDIVHRDIKPSNILIMPNGRPKIMDFGVAQVPDDQYTTRVGLAIGTPAFMAPEQVKGENVGPRADQYALAMTLYKVFTGHTAFRAERNEQLVYMQLHEPPPPLSGHNPNLPFAIEMIVLKGLSKAPDDRFGSCSEMIEMMRMVLGDYLDTPAYAIFPEAERHGDARVNVGSQFDHLFGGAPFFQRHQKELLIGGAALAILAVGLLFAQMMGRPAGNGLLPDGTPPPLIDELQQQGNQLNNPDVAAPSSDVEAVDAGVETSETGAPEEDVLGADSKQDDETVGGTTSPEVVPEAIATPDPTEPHGGSAPSLPPADSGLGDSSTTSSMAADAPALPLSPDQTSENLAGQPTDPVRLDGAVGTPPLVIATPTPMIGYDPNLAPVDNILQLDRFVLEGDIKNFLENEMSNNIERSRRTEIRRTLLLLPGPRRERILGDFEIYWRKYRKLRCTLTVLEFHPQEERVEVVVRILLRGVLKSASDKAVPSVILSRSPLRFQLESRDGEWFFVKFADFLDVKDLK